MKVYRVERHKIGPFYQGAPRAFQLPAPEPAPVNFNDEDDFWQWIFGCSSIEALFKYFGYDNLSILLDAGFEVKEYDRPEEEIRFSEDGIQVAILGTRDPDGYKATNAIGGSTLWRLY